ncbi:MAG TPA: zf-HC2 domain-containing protein [Haliangium sp.]|nr:zf-HC2 domain-containing protein [Haliangium sp.]
MANCTTFDLLLVDWLYDELEPAEAARFTRHIDGCDACWHMAEAMTRMRALMRELPEELPPEAVSARILHQAAEQVAGTRRRGLWAWLAGSLEVAWAHPAAAALATMVLVAGVAGALFTRGKLEMAAPATSRSAEGAQLGASHAPAAGEETAVAAVPAAPAAETVPTSEKRAAEPGETEAQRERASGARGKVRRAGVAAEPDRSRRFDTAEQRPAPEQRVPSAVTMDLGPAVESDPSQERQIALDDEVVQDRADAEASRGAGRAAGLAGGATASAPATTPGDAATPAPTTAANTKPDGNIDDKSERAPRRQETRKRDDRTWAETMHGTLRAALRQQECARAVGIAEDIRARDPGYYRTSIADSKELAACRQAAQPQGQAGKNSASDAN